MLKLFRKVICTSSPPWLRKIVGESSGLSLIIAGSSTNAAFGGVSAGGGGNPESEVTHVVLDQPNGSAGGITVSKFSERRNTGSHPPATLTATATLMLATIIRATTKKQSKPRTIRAVEAVDAPFGSPVTTPFYQGTCRRVNLVRDPIRGALALTSNFSISADRSLRCRPRRWRWACPGGRVYRLKGKDVDGATHAVFTVRKTEVGISARMAKGVLINGACIGKNSPVAVRIIRRTKLAIRFARRAAGNTVTAAHPSPPNCVARDDSK
jgi:hypothetical protein